MRLFLWRKRTNTPFASPSANNSDSPRQVAPPPASTMSEQDETETRSYVGRKFGDLIDDIVADHHRQGGFENLEGKGKSLDLEDNVHEDYYLYKTMKNANVLPPWLELQHEIRDAIQGLIKQLDRGEVTDTEQRLEKINQKITRYNEQCPGPLFQKSYLTSENVRSQCAKWE